MKKSTLYLVSLLLLFSIPVFSANHYWVGGTGEWNSSSHWSLISGGSAGATIPTLTDDVIFDNNSFASDKQTVMLNGAGTCKSINWSGISRPVVFSSAINSTLTVSGSYTLSPLLWYAFKGKTIFAASSYANTINTFGRRIIGDFIFDGTGSWGISDELTTSATTTLKLKRGTLNTNGNTITCGFFNGNSTQVRSLNLSNSEIHIKDTWDFSAPQNLNFSAGTSRIIFDNIFDSQHFLDGGLIYNSFAPLTTFCTPSGTACAANLVITLAGTNVTCNGQCNGTATVVSVTGGSGNYSYLWSPGNPSGQGTTTITGLCANTYTVRVKDNVSNLFCFCSVEITAPPVLFDFELFSIEPSCNGFCNASSGVDATGGTFPYTYLWTPTNIQNDTATNLCAGTYTVTVTDSRGCTEFTLITLAEPNPLTIVGTSTNISCFGTCNGTATATITGGTAPYTYVWSNGVTTATTNSLTNTVNNLCQGSYTVTVTDAHACVISTTYSITEPPLLTLALSKTNITCNGACNGTATATITGGVSPYNYVWSNGVTTLASVSLTNSINSLCPGTYTVTVTDANGCVKTSSINITQPPLLNATTVVTNVTCNGACNGIVTATVSGGTSPYSYVWSNGVSTLNTGSLTNTINSLCPGTYTLTVTDANSCVKTVTAVISEPLPLLISASAVNITCNGTCNGTATAAVSGGTSPYTYVWSNGVTTTNTPSLTNTISSLCPATYTATVTDAHGCINTTTVTITAPPPLTVTTSKTNVTCHGVCDGTATANVAGGTSPYTYVWSTGATTASTPTLTNTINLLCTGSYTVTVTDASGCVATATVSITQPPTLNASINPTAILCNGDCNALISTTVTGGTPTYTFLWAPGGQTSASISNQCAGTYSVTVTDSHSCTAINSVTINQPTALNLVSNSINITCFGLCNGAAAAIGGGGTPPYTFLWLPGGQTTASISNQCAGTYSVTLRDFNNCTLTNVVTITQPAQLLANPSITTNITCTGDCNAVITSAPTGGVPNYTFSWGPGNPTGQGTNSISSLCAGTYSVTVTDSSGCTSTQNTSITQPLILNATISGSTSSCNICNGSATVTPSGGVGPYTFLWAPTGQTTQTATGLCPNITYTVTVTDVNGCTATNSVPIFQTVNITITTLNSTLTCFGTCDGTATANASGGTLPYSYLWSNLQTTQSVSNLCAATYTVTVSDLLGCFNSASVTFTDPPVLNVTSTSTNVSCAGVCNGTATANPTGGTGTYTYSWNTFPVQHTQTATGLCAGSYTVTVNDSSGCTATSIVNITQQNPVVDNPIFTLPNCNASDGVITVNPSGGTPGYTFVWSPGNPSGQGTTSINNLFAGSYSLTITDGSGCNFDFTYLLNNPNGPTLSISKTDITCHNLCNGTATVIASGGAGGYIYDWLPGSPAGDGTTTISLLCAGLYNVQVTDAGGCVSLDSISITNPQQIIPHQTVTNETCGGACNGSVILAPTGGTGAYTYLWASGGQTTSSLNSLCAGTYTVTISDANLCDTVLIVSVSSPPTLSVSLNATNVLCNGACNGTATATVTGGTGSYSYTWSQGAFITPGVVNLCPNTYTVTVTDANLCSANTSIIITEPLLLTAAISQTNVSCNGVCDGTAAITTSGGTQPYSYLWSAASNTNASVNSLCAGVYNVAVTDNNGCTITPSLSVNITQPSLLVTNATFTNPTCHGLCNGTATVNPTGGSGTYTYLWMPGNNTNQSISGLCAGTYTLVVTDVSSCSVTQIITLIEPPVLIANPSATSPTCNNSCNGSVSASPVGGTAGYSYNWLPINSSLQTVNNLCPNTYTLVVTDSHNCKDTQTVVISNPLPINISVGGTPASCGICDGSIIVTPTTGTPNYTFVWTPLVTGQGTNSATQLCAGIYSVLVTDSNGCDSTFTLPMNNVNGPTGETVSTIPASCNGVCDASGSLVPVGGIAPYTFLWNTIPPVANDTATNLCAGNYFVQVTDSSGCIHFSPVTITEPSAIVDNATVTSAACSNICTGAIIVNPTGGAGGYTFAWSPGNPTGQGTSSVSALCPGTYTLVITDADLCFKTFTYTITQSAPLNASIHSNTITCSSACTGVAYITISSGTPPFTIQWNDALAQTNDTASALCAGSYTVNVTDANGCTLSLSTTITASLPISATATIVDAACGLCDGQATVAPSGGTGTYTYLWSNNQTTSSIASLCAGLYGVNITDGAGCTTNLSVPVSNTNGPTSATFTSTNATCFGLCNGFVNTISPIGGTAPYTYLWIASGQTTQAVSNLCAGIYFVQITDVNGCSLVTSLTITEPAQIFANQIVTANICGVCNGVISINPSGCAGGFNVLWSNGSTALSLTNLCSGIYSVQITCNSGCSQNETIPLSSQNGPSLTTSSTDANCNSMCNGTATVVATGGANPYAYLWNDGSAQITPIATSLCAGSYFVQVTGNDGCVSIGNVGINEPSAIGLSNATSVNPLCNGDANGSVTVIASGGTFPYIFNWQPGGSTNATVSNLSAGTYTVTLTDLNGCTATQTNILTQPTIVSINGLVTNPSCNNLTDGAINITVTGGTPNGSGSPYSYQWSGNSSAVTEDLNLINAGTYSISATDANGCTANNTFTLTPASVVIADAGNDTSFCEAGALMLNASSSVNALNYQWFQSPSNTVVGSIPIVNITPPNGTTVYYVIVSNGTGCADNDTVTITSNPLPVANAGINVSILSGASISIGGNPTGPGGSVYSWTPSQNLNNTALSNPIATPTVTTTYTVTVTSPQGCISSDDITIIISPEVAPPSGFSPNGDGVNDVWIIDNIELYPNCVVEVYNRWGELLFQSTGYKEKWDGTFKDKPLPVGTYYYIINLNDEKFPDAQTGPLTIMR